MLILPEPIHFLWGKGNELKNFVKHRVTIEEIEEIFFDPDKKMLDDLLHSQTEPRHLLLGLTKQHRLLFVVFTVRNRAIRIISARDLNKKERSLYEENS